MTQAISDSAFQTLMGQVADAIASASWASAHSLLAQAEAVLVAMPVEAGQDGAKYRRREDLEKMHRSLDAAEAAAAKAQSVITTPRIGYARVGGPR